MTKLRFTTALEVFEAFPAARQLIAAAPERAHPIAFLTRLAASGTARDALGFAAFILPRREAVWWAVQTLKIMLPEAASDPGLKAAEVWVREPGDATRQAALAAGESGDNEAPGSWAALAAGYSGGSMVASHPVPTPPDLTAKAVRIGVLLAWGRVPATRREAVLRSSIEACIRLADDDGATTGS
jgi:hypothetical protein